MADTSRINHLLSAIKEVDTMLMKHTVPLTLEEKQALLTAHSNSWNIIMHQMPVEKKCSNCKHCVFWEGKHCCSAWGMKTIMFERMNDTGGCGRWEEADFVPF